MEQHHTLIELNNGTKIPSIGLGTWQSKPGEVEKAVEHALKAGYRHIDGAWAYQNEAEFGAGIKASGVKREDIFITSKLWCTYHKNAEACLNETLSKLGTDYLDLYLVHWPIYLNPNGNSFSPRLPDGTRDILDPDSNVNVWKAMEALYKSGKVKAIGVSNWSIPKLQVLLEHAEVVPAVNQVELHPYLPQHELLEFCRSKGICVEAYSPLGSSNSPLLDDADIVKIANKHHVDPSNILISYQLNRGIVVLPKSVTPSRITANLASVRLDDEDMATLDGIHHRKTQRFVAPDWGPTVKLGFADME